MARAIRGRGNMSYVIDFSRPALQTMMCQPPYLHVCPADCSSCVFSVLCLNATLAQEQDTVTRYACLDIECVSHPPLHKTDTNLQVKGRLERACQGTVSRRL